MDLLEAGGGGELHHSLEGESFAVFHLVFSVYGDFCSYYLFFI
jgi:hypothetical protein